MLTNVESNVEIMVYYCANIRISWFKSVRAITIISTFWFIINDQVRNAKATNAISSKYNMCPQIINLKCHVQISLTKLYYTCVIVNSMPLRVQSIHNAHSSRLDVMNSVLVDNEYMWITSHCLNQPQHKCADGQLNRWTDSYF